MLHWGQNIYNIFFDNIHPKGVVEKLLAKHYQDRWFVGASLRRGEGHKRHRTDADWLHRGKISCKHLRWIGKCVPARVHIANMRFHCNGWHTEARYQRRSGSVCMFCELDNSEDSIEHILHT